jgi:hypothetical protein
MAKGTAASLMFGLLAAGVVATASGQALAATYHLSPNGAGRMDGTSWKNAARLSALPTLVDKAGPGGEVLLRADQGAYEVTSTIQLRAGGKAGAAVTIRGADASGAPRAAEIVSDRNVAAGRTGSEVFRFMNGADHLVFEGLVFRNVGNGAFRFGADVQDVTIRRVKAHNVQRFIENNASKPNATASVTGLVLKDIQIQGFSRGAVRLRYNSSDVLIEDVQGDSEKQAHDNFAVGVTLEGTVHDVIIRRTAMGNAYNSKGEYWNGDGFTTERGVYNVRFENTRAFGNTDAGYDLKSKDTVLKGAYAGKNKRNFRVWSDSVTLQDCTGDDPHKAGGSGSEAQVWLADNARATVVDSRFINSDKAAVFELSKGARLNLKGAVSYAGAGAVYSELAEGAAIDGRASPTR